MRRHRFDPLTGLAVILTDERPGEVSIPEPPDGPVPCPHCPEHAVGRTLAARPDGSARAVPHRIPALRVEEAERTSAEGPWLEADGLGAHEVLVESTEHRPLRGQPVERSVSALLLLRERLADLRRDRRLASFAWWREEGASGCHHPVSQLVALPYVPEAVARSAREQVAWAARQGGSLLGELLAADEADGRRVVWRSPHAVAVCPWAPRAAFEVWVVPRPAGGFPADAPEAVWADVARGVWHVSRALAGALGSTPVTTSLASGPVDAPPAVGWFLRVRPATALVRGLEESVGTAIVGVFPEESAARLRSVLANPDPLVP